MYCKYCGKNIQNNIKFCKYCGKQLSDNKGQDEPKISSTRY